MNGVKKSVGEFIKLARWRKQLSPTLKMPKVVICETMLKPQEVAVPSSAGDGSYYTVFTSTLLSDSFCDCKGFLYRGYCKHVEAMESGRCTYHHPADEEKIAKEGVGRCICGQPLVVYELDPEYD